MVLVGFGGHRCCVIAGQAWEVAMEAMPIPEAITGSWEDGLHLAAPEDQRLLLDDLRNSDIAMRMRGHRAIGVVYHPERKSGNYVVSVLPIRYDAFIFIDETSALNPPRVAPERDSEAPETYSSAV